MSKQQKQNSSYEAIGESEKKRNEDESGWKYHPSKAMSTFTLDILPSWNVYLLQA